MEPTNTDRIERAQSALTHYQKERGDPPSLRDVEEGATDLLTDLLHLAHSRGISVPVLIYRAAGHFFAETNDVVIGWLPEPQLTQFIEAQQRQEGQDHAGR